jgi:hypothetical protein
MGKVSLLISVRSQIGVFSGWRLKNVEKTPVLGMETEGFFGDFCPDKKKGLTDFP